MNKLQSIWRTICSLWQRREMKHQIDDELAFHIEQRAAANIASGMSPGQAAQEARKSFGNVQKFREECRDVRGANFGETVLQDIRFGLRILRKNPGFTLVAVLTLGLGIGANAAIFTFVNALLFKPLGGVSAPSELVQVARKYDGRTTVSDSSYPDYLDYRRQNTSSSGLAMLAVSPFHLTVGQEAERVSGELVSCNYFDVLGVKPALGRLIAPSDVQGEDAAPVVAISHRYWQSRFGGNSDIIGRTVKLDGSDHTVIGVTSEGFAGTRIGDQRDVWVPLLRLRQIDSQRAALLRQRNASWLEVFGRLKPGTTAAAAQAEFNMIADRLRQDYPQTNAKVGVSVEAGLGTDSETRRQVRRFAIVPSLAVGIVLLIACANVAGLLLARAAGRQRELGIRLAIGAGHLRLFRQMLTESLLLACLGGVAGLFIGIGLIRILRSVLPERYLSISFNLDFGADWHVFAFTFIVAALTALLFGLVPAIRGVKINPALAMTSVRGTVHHGAGVGLRSALVVLQVARSLVLLVAAGLVVGTLRNAMSIDTGYETNHILTARLDLGRQTYDAVRGAAFQQQLLDRLQGMPGVEAAAFAVTLPVNDGRWSTTISPELAQDRRVPTYRNLVSNEYLKTMKISLIEGREFSSQDNERTPRVAIINQTLARQLWPDQNPLGQRLMWSSGSNAQQPLVVIGLVRDIKGRDLFVPPDPLMYLPWSQNYQSAGVLHIRTVGNPQQFATALRREVNALDHNLPLYELKPLSDHLKATLTPQRLLAWVVGQFGLLALVLAGIGLYGLMAYTVAQRTPEIGIRMSLGASTGHVLMLVMKQGMKLALGGVLVGLIAAWMLTRFMKGLLYGISPTDPLTFALISLGLLVVAGLACWLPARRAARIDPMVALRYE